MRQTLSLLMMMFSVLCLAQRDWDAITIKTNKINERISYLEGSGGNIGVLHGAEGVLIVDDQFAELSEKIKTALADLSQSELKFIVNTHYHGDHSGGNEALSEDGATIVAHANVRERLATTFYSDLWERDIEAKPESFWPQVTFSEAVTFYLNGEEVQIVHVPNAHTDGDVLVHFKTSNVIHCGDGFVRYGYPFIDVPAGGSIDGMIAMQEKILELADAETTILPGHGGLSTKSDVEEILGMLTETRQLIADLKEEGKSLDDCINAAPFEDYHERWSGDFIDSDLFVRLIYESLE